MAGMRKRKERMRGRRDEEKREAATESREGIEEIIGGTRESIFFKLLFSRLAIRTVSAAVSLCPCLFFNLVAFSSFLPVSFYIYISRNIRVHIDRQ